MQVTNCGVPDIWERKVQSFGNRKFSIVTAASATRSNTYHINRAVADVMRAVASKIL